MKNIIKNSPFHAFLIVQSLIFFLFVHNYSTTSFTSTFRSYEIVILISLVIFCLSYLINRQKHKAGVITTAIMLAIFFYGFIYELAEKMYYKGLWPFSEIHRYIALAIFLFTILLCYFLYKTKRTFHSLTYTLNIFVLVLFSLNLLRLSFFVITADKKSIVYESSDTSTHFQNNDSMPDIYYIILDAYANDSILSEIYHYKKNSLTEFIKERNFFIASGSRTNYISTLPSLSSSLNYSYLDSIDRGADGQKNIIYKNRVSGYLKNKGYEIVHVKSGFAVSRENYDADTTIRLENMSEFERTLLQYSILRLDDLLGYARYLTLKEQLTAMYAVFNVKGPKYVFLHIVSPHPPYVCDENGKFRSSKRVINVWWEPKEDYASQLKYINKEMIRFISEILKRSKVKPIIILQSDHGPFIQSNSLQDIYNTRSMILNSYYIPYSWKSKLYSTITPVNSFRLLFNGLFDDSIPIIKDIPLDSSTVINNINSNLKLKTGL